MIAESPSWRARSFVPLTQCAWCSRVSILGQRVRIPGAGIVTGTLTIAIPAVARWDFAMSHGICPTCASEVGKQMDDL